MKIINFEVLKLLKLKVNKGNKNNNYYNTKNMTLLYIPVERSHETWGSPVLFHETD